MSSGHPRVRVVVLNWNGGEHVMRCIQRLTCTDWPADRLEIVVLDNASTDGSDLAIAETFGERVEVRPTGANLGFVANNLAMADLAGTDFVALVNNDAFVEPGWLAPLVYALLADAGLGAACPRILFAPAFHELRIESPVFVPPADGRALGVRIREVATQGRSVFHLSQFVSGAWGIEPDADGRPFRWLGGEAVIRAAAVERDEAAAFGFVDVELAAEATKQAVLCCGLYRNKVTVTPEWQRICIPCWQQPFDVVNNAGGVVIEDGFGADRGYLQVDGNRFDSPAEVFNWCGGGVLLRSRYLEHVGLLDERFFLYYEDTDLSWRGQAKGWRYLYVPDSVILHLHAASSGEGSDTFQFFVERNRLMMLTKNAPARLALGSVVGSVTATLSYARHDVLRPLLGRRRPPLRLIYNRSRSFASYLRWLPPMLVARRRLRPGRTLTDADLSGRLTTRRDWNEDSDLVASGAGWSIPSAGDSRNQRPA